MNSQITTKLKINKRANEVFEAFVDPAKIGNYWFTSSSERWEQGKAVTLRYDEYGAEGVIHVVEVEDNRKIEYTWGAEHGEETLVTITLKEVDHGSTIVEVTESGFKQDDPEIFNKMLGQKEGWVYMLTCLKGYLDHGINDLRASLIH